jgi:hypothetical protein
MEGALFGCEPQRLFDQRQIDPELFSGLERVQAGIVRLVAQSRRGRVRTRAKEILAAQSLARDPGRAVSAGYSRFCQASIPTTVDPSVPSGPTAPVRMSMS